MVVITHSIAITIMMALVSFNQSHWFTEGIMKMSTKPFPRSLSGPQYPVNTFLSLPQSQWWTRTTMRTNNQMILEPLLGSLCWISMFLSWLLWWVGSMWSAWSWSPMPNWLWQRGRGYYHGRQRAHASHTLPTYLSITATYINHTWSDSLERKFTWQTRSYISHQSVHTLQGAPSSALLLSQWCRWTTHKSSCSTYFKWPGNSRPGIF